MVQAYIDALATCLMEGAEDPTQPAHARMCELIRADVSLSHTSTCTCSLCMLGPHRQQATSDHRDAEPRGTFCEPHAMTQCDGM